MIWLATLSLLFAAVPAFLFLRNLRILRPAPNDNLTEKTTAVLIPARDEEVNIKAAVVAALDSGATEVLVLDDHSTDGTASMVSGIASTEPRLRLLAGEALPPGWCGKNFACAQLAAATEQSVLIFADADVRLAANSAPRLAEALERAGAQLVSGVPREITITFSERFLLPLIHFLLLGFLPLKQMRRSMHPAYGAACGQLIVAEAVAYRKAGGHTAIRNRIHEGLALPRSFRAHGLRTDLFDATDVAVCRMYRSSAEVWRGLTKNTHEGLGAPAVILPMTIILLLGQVAPWLILLLATTALVRAVAAAALALSLLPRLCAQARFHQSLGSVLWHPLAIVALLGLQWFGLGCYLLGRPVAWKGRTYAAPEN
ncbi:MAG: glycosyltransferase [Chthoniobacterales bacterium]